MNIDTKTQPYNTEYREELNTRTKKYSFVNSLMNAVENDVDLTLEQKIQSKSQISSELSIKNSKKYSQNFTIDEYDYKSTKYTFQNTILGKGLKPKNRGLSSSFVTKEIPASVNPKSISARANKTNFFKSHHHSNSINIPKDFIKNKKMKKNNFTNFSSKNLTDFSSNGISSINLKSRNLVKGEFEAKKQSHRDKYLIYKRTRSRKKKSNEKKIYELIYKKRGYRGMKKKYNYEVLSLGNHSISRISDKFNTSKYSIQDHRKRLVRLKI